MSTEDTFHPLGEEWEGELEEMLDETEYDTDLGLEMARDAMRVTKGELSEAEFHERYHEDVLEEFDVDDRPTEAAWEEAKEADDEGLVERLADVDSEQERREVMKKMGAGAAAVGLGAWGTADNMAGEPEEPASVAAAQEDDDDGTQWGMAIDLEHCDGCLSCVVACSQENNLDMGVNWMYIFHYEDEDAGNDPKMMVRPCQHCSDAPCAKVCPTTARHVRNSDGLVLTDYDVCIGCRYCQVACPYGVNYFQWDEPDVPMADLDTDHVYDANGDWVDSRAPRGVMSKCTMCPTRQDGGYGDDNRGTTACEQACPPGIIHFGDLNDPESDPNQFLDEAREDPEKPSSFRLLEDVGTNPNIVYVGHEPGPNADQISAEEARDRGLGTAVSYEEIGLVDNRKTGNDEHDGLDGGTIGGGLSP